MNFLILKYFYDFRSIKLFLFLDQIIFGKSMMI